MYIFVLETFILVLIFGFEGSMLFSNNSLSRYFVRQRRVCVIVYLSFLLCFNFIPFRFLICYTARILAHFTYISLSVSRFVSYFLLIPSTFVYLFAFFFVSSSPCSVCIFILLFVSSFFSLSFHFFLRIYFFVHSSSPFTFVSLFISLFISLSLACAFTLSLYFSFSSSSLPFNFV